MADGAVYGPKTNLFLFNALPLFAGRAQGTYFTFNYDNPVQWVATAGVDGQGYYTTHGNRAATMTLVVVPNSEDNDILAASLLAQNQSPIGLRWPILVQQGLTIYTGFGVVQGDPPLEYSDTAAPVTWTIVSTRMIGKRAGQPAAPVGS